jgi:hypothetical protein
MVNNELLSNCIVASLNETQDELGSTAAVESFDHRVLPLSVNEWE